MRNTKHQITQWANELTKHDGLPPEVLRLFEEMCEHIGKQAIKIEELQEKVKDYEDVYGEHGFVEH